MNVLLDTEVDGVRCLLVSVEPAPETEEATRGKVMLSPREGEIARIRRGLSEQDDRSSARHKFMDSRHTPSARVREVRCGLARRDGRQPAHRPSETSSQACVKTVVCENGPA